MRPTLLVLSAGIGSRYGGLKQLDPVGPSGEIIIDYSIYDAIRAGFGKVVFVIRKDIEKDFKYFIGKKYQNKIDIEYAFQEIDKLPAGFKVPDDRKKPWGTGHAILISKNQIKESFAVINADDFYGKSGYKLIADYLVKNEGHAKNYCMAGFTLGKTLSEFGSVSRGVCSTDRGGFLENVVERTKIEKQSEEIHYVDEAGISHLLTGEEIVSMNMWGFSVAIFTHLEKMFTEFLEKNISNPKAEFFIPSVVNALIEEKKANVKVLESSDSWFGITYREDKNFVVRKIRELIDSGVYPAKLF